MNSEPLTLSEGQLLHVSGFKLGSLYTSVAIRLTSQGIKHKLSQLYLKARVSDKNCHISSQGQGIRHNFVTFCLRARVMRYEFSHIVSGPGYQTQFVTFCPKARVSNTSTTLCRNPRVFRHKLSHFDRLRRPGSHVSSQSRDAVGLSHQSCTVGISGISRMKATLRARDVGRMMEGSTTMP